MKTSSLVKMAVGLTILGGASVVTGGVALAHHPDIAAEAVCDVSTGVAMINFTSTSWEGFGPDPTNDSSRENPHINVTFDGVLVGTGAFAAPDYTFSGSAPVPAGKVAGSTVVVTATAVGPWGIWPSGGEYRSTTITIPPLDCRPPADPGVGRFTGGGHQVGATAQRVTLGLTIHCDLTLSNNLEVNWNRNQFHMNEHLQTLACSDDPSIGQPPPAAPLDTLVGVGTGRFNGADGYTVEFTLVDSGEPGVKDQVALRIYETANPSNVVLNLGLSLLTGGNLQAHYDQPHK